MPSLFDSDYKEPAGKSNYLKLVNGTHKVRILAYGISGYVFWVEQDEKRKPKRAKDLDSVPARFQREGKDQAKAFVAFPVWNYAEERIQILEITQASVRKSIRKLANDDDWGDPRTYDIKIERTGTKMDDTKYDVNPVNPQKSGTVPPEALADLKKLDIEALFRGEDPFAALGSDKPSTMPKTTDLADDSLDDIGKLSPKQISTVIRAAAASGMDDDQLEAICLAFGNKDLSRIESTDYEKLIEEIKSHSTAETPA